MTSGIRGRDRAHLVGDAARLGVGAVDVEERVRAVAERLRSWRRARRSAAARRRCRRASSVGGPRSGSRTSSISCWPRSTGRSPTPSTSKPSLSSVGDCRGGDRRRVRQRCSSAVATAGSHGAGCQRREHQRGCACAHMKNPPVEMVAASLDQSEAASAYHLICRLMGNTWGVEVPKRWSRWCGSSRSSRAASRRDLRRRRRRGAARPRMARSSASSWNGSSRPQPSQTRW